MLPILLRMCANGELNSLISALSGFNKTDVRSMLSEKTFDGEICLVSTSRKGHLNIVKFLIEEWNVSVDQTGSVIFDSERVEGVTALWCASAAGHLEIVKYLIEKGADTNKRTITNSTPLRAACFDGHIDVVKYLVEHNADFEIPNRHGHTCLMIACYRLQHNVVTYLLDQGARINRQSSKGNTALHDCAESGNHVDIIILLDNKAMIRRDEYGMTPIMSAANAGQTMVVRQLQTVYSDLLSFEEVIAAFELLGCHYVDKNFDRVNALDNFSLAIHLREKHGLNKEKRFPFGWNFVVELIKDTRWLKLSGYTYSQVLNMVEEIKDDLLKEMSHLRTEDDEIPIIIENNDYLLPVPSEISCLSMEANELNPFPNQWKFHDDGYYYICNDYNSWVNRKNTPPFLISEPRLATSMINEAEQNNYINKTTLEDSSTSLIFTIGNLPSDIVKKHQAKYRTIFTLRDAIRMQLITRKAFTNVNQEFTTIEDLEAAFDDHPTTINLHTILMRMRILGPQHCDLLYQLRYRGALFADSGSARNCLYLWMYVLELERLYVEPLAHISQASFSSCLELFYVILRGRISSETVKDFQASWLIHTFELILNALARAQKWYHSNWYNQRPWAYSCADKESRNLSNMCVTALCLIFLLMEYYDLDEELYQSMKTRTVLLQPVTLTDKEKIHVFGLIRHLITLGITLNNGNNLLHLCFHRHSMRNHSHSNSQALNLIGDRKQPYPLVFVGILLIKLGHPPHLANMDKLRPIELLIDVKTGISDDNRRHDILGFFLCEMYKYGAHLDVNSSGKCILAFGHLTHLLKCRINFENISQRLPVPSVKHLDGTPKDYFQLTECFSLKCLASRVVKYSDLDIRHLPVLLRYFVELH